MSTVSELTTDWFMLSPPDWSHSGRINAPGPHAPDHFVERPSGYILDGAALAAR